MKKHSLYLALVSGLIGLTVGAGSMYAAMDASLLTRKAHRAMTESTTREIQQQGEDNAKLGRDANAVYPRKTLP